jgi:hypothetical protein
MTVARRTKTTSTLKSAQSAGRRPRDNGRAIFQPTEATEIAARLLCEQDPTLTRTAAIRLLADLGAGRAAYDALRSERVRERKAVFLEMMDALEGSAPATDRSWDDAVMSLRGGAPDDTAG